MREILTSGSTRGEWAASSGSPSLLLYRLNAICSGGYQNYGYLQQYYCVYNTEDCQGDTCESDLCDGAVCGYGQGWITYCTGAACAQYPGCLSCF